MDTMFETYGETTSAEVEALAKALTAPTSSDDLYNTPGGVITMQSLEGMLVDLTLNSNAFTLWQDVPKNKAFSTVEEFDRQTGLGISAGGFVGELENPEFRDPDFEKQIAIVKFMSEGWQVGDVSMSTRQIIDQRTRVQRSAMNRLLRNLNTALYTSDSTMVSKSFDGLAATIAGESTDQIIDARGGNLTMNTFNIAGQIITEANANAAGANIYVSPAGVQNLSKIIETGATSTGDRKIVEMGNSGITIGGKITGIMSAYGSMNPRMDKLLGMAFENYGVPQYRSDAGVWTEGATSDKAPSIPTVTVTENASTTGSLFSAGTVRPSAVTYSYRVVAKNNYGRSIGSVAVTAGAVAAGGSVNVIITPNPADSGSKTPSCFEIFSEKVAGSGIYRYLTTVAADSTNPLAAVTYVDKNDYIPGTTRMYIVDQTGVGEDRVMAFSQLLPIHNTDLAKTGRFSQGLINLYGVPKFYKPNSLIEIRNIAVDQTNQNRYNFV